MSTVALRPATAEDGKFIASSWLNSFQSAYHVKRMSSETYYSNHRGLITSLVDRGVVTVACDPQDPWTIWGWGCHEYRGSVLVAHYVYVKNAFRSLGVGSTLFSSFLRADTDSVLWTHDTKVSRSFLKGLRESETLPASVSAEYNPYVMYRP